MAGASGTLGSAIVRALLDKGAHVRAMVRATSDRSKLESIGVTDYVVADLNDPRSLERAMTAEPRAEAVVASAAGFTVHSRRTKGNNSRADIEGYQSLVGAAKNAGIPRLVLISILECDKAPGVPHFRQKFLTEQYLAEQRQPYLSLRAGAFIDRTRDIVPAKLRKGIYPEWVPGVPMSMIYTPDLARNAAQAALDVSLGAESKRRCMLGDTGHRSPDGRNLRSDLGAPRGRQARYPILAFRCAAAIGPFGSLFEGFVRRAELDPKRWLCQPGYREAKEFIWRSTDMRGRRVPVLPRQGFAQADNVMSVRPL